MRGLHESYPAYGFDQPRRLRHAVHQTAICEHGVCELHRLSFASVAYQQLGLGLDGQRRTADDLATAAAAASCDGRRGFAIANVTPGPRSAPSAPSPPCSRLAA